MAIGIVLSLRQVLRLYPEIAWVNNFRLADPGLAVDRPPVLLAPMAAILGSRVGRMAMSVAIDARHSRLDRHAPRRGARYFPLHDRPARVPRPARHVLGPDRNREFGRRRHSGPEGERRCRRHVRLPARGPRRAAVAAWAFRFRPRCSDSPARWCSASSTCNRARRRTASIPNSRTGSRPPSTTRPPSRRSRPASPARCARRSSACAKRSTRPAPAKPPPPPWPISPRRSRAWCTTCAPNSR